MEKEQLIILDYLQTKLNQAQKDIELFSLMIQEIESLQKTAITLKKNNDFLKVVKNG